MKEISTQASNDTRDACVIALKALNGLKAYYKMAGAQNAVADIDHDKVRIMEIMKRNKEGA